MRTICLSVSCLLSIVAQAWAVGFIVTPPRFELPLAPGSPQTHTVSVLNIDSTAPVRLRAYLSDWTIKPSGQMSTARPGTLPYSCSDWVEVNPAEFEVAPRAERVVRFTIRVPDSAFGSYWTMLYFESQPDTTRKSMVGLLMKARVGSPIYAVVSGTEIKQAELTGFSYRRRTANSHQFTLQLANTGNVHLRAKGSLAVKDGSGAVAAVLSLSDDVVLPQSRRDIAVTLDQVLAPGRYTAVVELDCGTPELIQGETGFEVAK